MSILNYEENIEGKAQIPSAERVNSERVAKL